MEEVQGDGVGSNLQHGSDHCGLCPIILVDCPVLMVAPRLQERVQTPPGPATTIQGHPGVPHYLLAPGCPVPGRLLPGMSFFHFSM